MFKKKEELLTIDRSSWEELREYRKAPYRKRYLELEELAK